MAKKKTVNKGVKTSPKPVKKEVIEIKLDAPKPNGNLVGSWAFIIGFLIAIFTGVVGQFTIKYQILNFVLIACGIIIGFFNIKDHEAKDFLIAGTCLVLLSWLGLSVVAPIQIYADILYALQTLFVPATLIVAIRTLFVISHE